MDFCLFGHACYIGVFKDMMIVKEICQKYAKFRPGSEMMYLASPTNPVSLANNSLSMILNLRCVNFWHSDIDNSNVNFSFQDTL